MATLREYIDADFSRVMNLASTLSLTRADERSSPSTAYKVPGRVHYGFDICTKYISYFASSGRDPAGLCLCGQTNAPCIRMHSK